MAIGATGSAIESLSFSLENLPGLNASGVIALNTMQNHLDARASSGPPEAACFFIDWQSAGGGGGSADPVFWGAFGGSKVTRVNAGATCIQASGKWTVTVDLWQ